MAQVDIMSRPRNTDVAFLLDVWRKHVPSPHDIEYTMDLKGTTDFKVIKQYAAGLNEVRD